MKGNIMTNQEALDLFKGSKYMSDYSWQDEMSRLAIKALEKQIPKKMTDDGYHHITCDCGHRIDMCMRFEISYCPYCGQAIKWE